jgi:hypothetical protein
VPVTRILQFDKIFGDNQSVPLSLEQAPLQENLGGLFGGLPGGPMTRQPAIQSQTPHWDQAFHKG